MPFTIDRVEDAPIVILVHGGSQVMLEMGEVIAELNTLLDEQPEPVFLILDIRGLSMGLDDITQGASAAALKPDALLHHPKIRESLMISNDSLIKLAAQGLRTATFGSVRLRVFGSTDEAIATCREQIAAEAGGGSQHSAC